MACVKGAKIARRARKGTIVIRAINAQNYSSRKPLLESSKRAKQKLDVVVNSVCTAIN